MTDEDENDYLVSRDGKERLHFDEVANQIVHGQLGIRGILQGSKPRPRFLVQLLNALRERSGMVENESAFKDQVIPKLLFDDAVTALDRILQLRIHEEQQRAGTRLATVGWVLSSVGGLLGVLQLVLATCQNGT
jgi:hypothetical protein